MALADDKSKHPHLSEYTLNRALLSIALVYNSTVSSKYCHDRKMSELQKGAQLYIQFSGNLSRNIANEQDPFQKWFGTAQSMHIYGVGSANYMLPAELNAEELVLQILGVSGAKVLDWHDQYSFQLYRT
jgi:hypothetical protein